MTKLLKKRDCAKKNATELITNVLIGFRLFIVIY